MVLKDYLGGNAIYKILDKYNTGTSSDYKSFTASSKIYSIKQIIELFEEKSHNFNSIESEKYFLLASKMKQIFIDPKDMIVKNIFDLTADMTTTKTIIDYEENEMREVTNHKLKQSQSKDSSTEKIIFGSTSRNISTYTDLFITFPQLEYMISKIKQTELVTNTEKKPLIDMLVEKYQDLINNEFEIYCINELKSF
ncbi:hypothetical protein FIV53_02445 [Mycoplasma nasistruthionis]|uniref:Uncharacterized protein n=1 Tax=Mycoplasma nasistruthionis TaxID=353852 RepID=A0A4Y6I688_9MOLU|nr:hypothetical protein FIV53_02445 [Mycoplasma nasistruthionis]